MFFVFFFIAMKQTKKEALFKMKNFWHVYNYEAYKSCAYSASLSKTMFIIGFGWTCKHGMWKRTLGTKLLQALHCLKKNIQIDCQTAHETRPTGHKCISYFMQQTLKE